VLPSRAQAQGGLAPHLECPFPVRRGDRGRLERGTIVRKRGDPEPEWCARTRSTIWGHSELSASTRSMIPICGLSSAECSAWCSLEGRCASACSIGSQTRRESSWRGLGTASRRVVFTVRGLQRSPKHRETRFRARRTVSARSGNGRPRRPSDTCANAPPRSFRMLERHFRPLGYSAVQMGSRARGGAGPGNNGLGPWSVGVSRIMMYSGRLAR
jgi:hypothetical protein